MKENRKINEQVKSIFESRLSLQSTQRFLDECKIPYKPFEYYKSKEFIKKYFSKWTPFQRKSFLLRMVGVNYWEKFKEMLEEG